MGKLKTRLMDFNKETGTATCIYGYKGHLLVGEAQCHEDDMDMCSELVGMKLAETRAYLKFLKVRRDELTIRKDTLEGVFRNMMTSKDFIPYSSYAKKIQQSICETRCELHEVREAIANIPPYLKQDIEERDVLYKKLRKRRSGEEVYTPKFIQEQVSAE